MCPLPLTLAKSQTEPVTRAMPAKWVLAVAAGKGGVGKSTVTSLLAQSFKALGLEVGVLDADLYGPSQRLLLKEDIPPIKEGLSFKPALSRGIQTISMAHFKSMDEACAFRAPIANQLIQQFMEQVKWKPMDVLLIDYPPGTGDIVLTLGQKIPLTGALVVSTPGAVSTCDVNRCVDLFEQLQIPIFGLVENMSYLQSSSGPLYPFGQGHVQALADKRGYPVLAKLALEPLVSQLFEKGESFNSHYPEHELSLKLLDLAKVLKGIFEQPSLGCEPLDYEWKEEL